MIFIAAGTKDARIFVERLKKVTSKFLISTFSAYGAALYEGDEKVRHGALDKEGLRALFQDKKIGLILDMSHPYADQCSENLMDATKDLGILYYRYERPSIFESGIIGFDTYEEAAAYVKKSGQKTLLTIGSKALDYFDGVPKENLIIRALPMTAVMEKLTKKGYLPKQIILMQGPFSKEMNLATLLDFGIQQLLTKESGEIGGFPEKVAAAKEAGIPLLCIRRPFIEYENKVTDLEDLMKIVEAYLGQ